MLTHARNATAKDLIKLFGDTFSASEGAREGHTIADFVARLLGETGAEDLRVFVTWDGSSLVAAAVFSRLVYASDSRRVMILSPMAVASHRQGEGLGQGLIAHALGGLAREGVDIAMTYGDPNFYAKVGFSPVSVAQAAAPCMLSQPQGWLGQSLNDRRFDPLKGACTCVSALNDPALW